MNNEDLFLKANRKFLASDVETPIERMRRLAENTFDMNIYLAEMINVVRYYNLDDEGIANKSDDELITLISDFVFMYSGERLQKKILEKA